jgi:sorting nexin-1/2
VCFKRLSPFCRCLLYISYKVRTTTDRSGFTPGAKSVVRRYNDFTWLAGELSYDFPGVIVPPLPDKQSVGRFTDEFVESRRRSLEKFLQRVATHSELGHSVQFVAFLQADEGGLSAAKKEAKNVKSRASTVSTSWLDSMTTAKPELEKSAADIKIEEILQYVSLLEKQLTNVTKYADNLVKLSRETSIAFYDFAQGFNALGMSEGESVGPALSEVRTMYYVRCTMYCALCTMYA